MEMYGIYEKAEKLTLTWSWAEIEFFSIFLKLTYTGQVRSREVI